MFPTAAPLDGLLDELRRLRADAEAQWRRFDQTLRDLEERVEAVSRPKGEATKDDDPHHLRGSILWHGDIVSPIDEKWDAEA